MRLWTAWAILLTLSYGMALAEEEYSFDLSEIEKKPLHIGGYVEFSPVLFGLDTNSALYKLNLYDRDKENIREEYNFSALLDGSYKKGTTEFRAIVNTDLRKSYLGWSEETTLYEGYMSSRPSSAFNFNIGKKTLKWGTGYAWNPVAFLDRPKDPYDPDLAREGFVVASADYIKSFDGPLKTFSFTPVLMPVYDHINDDFGKINRLNFAAKTYFLLYNTDIDLLFLTGGSKTNRYGMDFSRNITSNFEIHGEFAFINDYEKRYINSDGTVFNNEYDATNYLLGLRYLTESGTTYIFEFFHDATGFAESEMTDYFSFIDQGYDTYLASGDDSLLTRASNLAEGSYNRRNPMRDYLYLRASQKEPFDILYFTPSLTGIFNVDDESFSIGPELLYTGIKNLELRLRTTFLMGDSYTEFGEKQNDYRAELRVRYYF
ncbi:MAG: hypothetical protein A2Y81_12010 [Nitrospirae bacterium RBG_13_43_8]|nr:MAG: hypothetical protein A2Y81_12010 [Nitrospirae bacterium RBG_13_43_8]